MNLTQQDIIDVNEHLIRIQSELYKRGESASGDRVDTLREAILVLSDTDLRLIEEVEKDLY